MPKVTLVNSCDGRERAWRYSRPTFDMSDLDMGEIGKMDIGFNSLNYLIFEVESSLLFRDFLFSIRPIQAWARSSRATPFSEDNLEISEEFTGGHDQWMIDDALYKVEHGAPQDKARESLPMTLKTYFTVGMDFRTVCGLIKTMMAVDEDLYKIYGRLFEKEIDHIKGYKSNTIRPFIETYMTNLDEKNGIAEVEGYMIGKYELKFPMASQFLRQSNAIIKTDLWPCFRKFGYLGMDGLDQTDTIGVNFVIAKPVYHNLMRMRSHWFADWAEDMWGTMVGDYTKDFTIQEFWDFIPQGGGKADPYLHDLMPRIKCEDPNLPCPVSLQMPSLIDERIAIFGRNTVIDRYEELVGAEFIIDNPNNELRLQYESALKNK